MGKYGLKIKNIEAGILYECNLGVRDYMETTDAMLTKSLFYDFLLANGLRTYNDKSTRDIICVQFGFGSSSYKEQVKKLERTIQKLKSSTVFNDCKMDKLQQALDKAKLNKDKYDKRSAQELRTMFYKDGVSVTYVSRYKNGDIRDSETIHYKMLYRTPGKAKLGSCMFIRDELFDDADHFLKMGIQLPIHNSPIVEIGAYSSLVTSTIVGKVKIEPENILILKDVDSYFNTDVVSVEIDDNNHCLAKHISDYKLKNTLFDGQALIDSSLFPFWADGYVLLRQHFFKAAAFVSNIKLFFKDYFGDQYETAEVVDMFGNKHLAKDIKLITTNNAIKWIKFDVSYEYWSDWVHKNGSMFGIVKTAHPSKLGKVQRMSYQMINALDMDTMPDVVQTSVDYIKKLKRNDNTFLDYLRDNQNFSNDFEVLLALVDQNPDFIHSTYFKERRGAIISNYVIKFRNGKVIQNGDNLVVVGSPYAMLLHSVGEDVNKDDTFEQEDCAMQCYTERFGDGEYLAEFRSPFNSCNNLGYLHNHYHDKFKRYFPFGKQIIAVNMIGTCCQDRNNGQDMDSDSFYVTNQKQIVEHARYCMQNYPTIVNNIPKEKNHYSNTPEDKALVDNKIAAGNMAIGESSNLAQLCLSYSYSFEDNEKYLNYACILSVLA